MNSESQFTFAADNRVVVHCDVNTLEITMSSVPPEIALSRVLPEVTATSADLVGDWVACDGTGIHVPVPPWPNEIVHFLRLPEPARSH